MLGRSTSLGMDSRSKASYHFALCRRQNGGLLLHHPWDQKSKQIFCKFLSHSVSPQEPTQPPHPTSRLDNSVRSRSRHLLLAVRSLRSSWASLLNARLLLSLPCLAHPQPVSTSTPINLESGTAGLAISHLLLELPAILQLSMISSQACPALGHGSLFALPLQSLCSLHLQLLLS